MNFDKCTCCVTTKINMYDIAINLPPTVPSFVVCPLPSPSPSTTNLFSFPIGFAFFRVKYKQNYVVCNCLF